MLIIKIKVKYYLNQKRNENLKKITIVYQTENYKHQMM